MTDPNFAAYVPSVRESFAWEPIPDGCILYEESTGKMITLNATAEAVLTHCFGEMTVDEICRKIEGEFQITREEAESVLKRLQGEGVI
jgi:hypothetical protein